LSGLYKLLWLREMDTWSLPIEGRSLLVTKDISHVLSQYLTKCKSKSAHWETVTKLGSKLWTRFKEIKTSLVSHDWILKEVKTTVFFNHLHSCLYDLHYLQASKKGT
jgi:hypothetical protein